MFCQICGDILDVSKAKCKEGEEDDRSLSVLVVIDCTSCHTEHYTCIGESEFIIDDVDDDAEFDDSEDSDDVEL